MVDLAAKPQRLPRVRAIGQRLIHKTHDMVFKAVHNRCLIYNTCWEDPRLDRQLLTLDGDSKVVMITSAGCNALDYLLDNPVAIHAIDVNPRQNALLDLKMALIRRGDFGDLFAMFGEGYHPQARALYNAVRSSMSPASRDYWDNKIGFFEGSGKKRSFYYHGTSGSIAWILTRYLFRRRKGIKERFYRLLEADNLAEQRTLYAGIEPELWGKFTSWLVKQPAAMTMLGVPRPQMRLISERYPGGMTGFVNDKLRHVLTEVPLKDNYFWRVYLTGRYTKDCCPNYLKEDHLPVLQERIDRIALHHNTITGFLQANPDHYSHFVLLDHQDWLAWNNPEALADEWVMILRTSRPNTKILMRSAAERVDFLPANVTARVRSFPELTEPLHPNDRVGTYGSQHLMAVR